VHHLLQAVKVVNGSVLWVNLFLLFCLSIIPFATDPVAYDGASPRVESKNLNSKAKGASRSNAVSARGYFALPECFRSAAAGDSSSVTSVSPTVFALVDPAIFRESKVQAPGVNFGIVTVSSVNW